MYGSDIFLNSTQNIYIYIEKYDFYTNVKFR